MDLVFILSLVFLNDYELGRIKRCNQIYDGHNFVYGRRMLQKEKGWKCGKNMEMQRETGRRLR